MRTHSPEEIREKMSAAFRTDDAQTDIEGLKNLHAMLSPDGKMPAGAPETVRKVLAISIEAVRSANVDLMKTYTDEFVNAAK